MVAVLRPGGPIAQLSSLFFFLSALVSDVLLIRLCLVVANACLLTSESAAWKHGAACNAHQQHGFQAAVATISAAALWLASRSRAAGIPTLARGRVDGAAGCRHPRLVLPLPRLPHALLVPPALGRAPHPLRQRRRGAALALLLPPLGHGAAGDERGGQLAASPSAGRHFFTIAAQQSHEPARPAAPPSHPQSLKFGRWLRVPAGAAITRGQGARLAFHVLVQGTATIRCLYRGVPEEPRMQYSGCCFDMGEAAAAWARPWSAPRSRPQRATSRAGCTLESCSASVAAPCVFRG